jgi:CHAD domain-containing protein
LTKSLTKVRDLDVQIAFLEKEISEISEQKFLLGLQRLLLRKQQLRDKKQTGVKQSILDFEKEKSLTEIQIFIDNNPFDSENFSPPNELKSLGHLEVEKLTKICFSFVPFITSPVNTEALHSLRIAMKNLRYTTELFQPIYPQLESSISTMKKFQDDLGEIHDYDVWLVDLDRFLSEEKQRINKFYGQSGPFNFIKPGITYLIDEIKDQKIKTHDKFLERWNDQFQNQFWANLRMIFENYDQ